jgi:hypothetical protein
MMQDAQFDPSVDLEYWNSLQAEYKNLYGKNYERTNSRTHCTSHSSSC